jgi:FAD/FMN-containing dehydrogenase
MPIPISRRRALLGASALFAGTSALRVWARSDRLDHTSLKSGFSGVLIGPEDAQYNQARRTQNLAFDHRPALIARCATRKDVVRVLDFARRRDALIAIRGGGHSQAGQSSCDGGVVIDLSMMDHVVVDRTAGTISCRAGTKIWQVYGKAAEAGLTLPLGTYPTVGVSGLTLGGGLGYLLGSMGAACDSLISAEVVLADGRVMQADETREPELFWALRGAGANFGIVTRLTFRAHRREKALAPPRTVKTSSTPGQGDLESRAGSMGILKRHTGVYGGA